jgi:hypothetical protein
MSWSIQAGSAAKFAELIQVNKSYQTHDAGKALLEAIGQAAEKFDAAVNKSDDTVVIFETNGHVDAISQYGNATVNFRVLPK